MARPELGSKHQCQNCGTRFFDLNKSPIACPKCGTTIEDLTRTAHSPVQAEDESVPGEVESELVPLEEADASEDKAIPVAEDEDVEIEADDTFLEEEEEEEDADDVGDLIDSDIRDDEER